MSTLWLVATPIGNLGDLSPRAIEVLDRAAMVCCEDTRRTRKLLQHAGIRAERLVVTNEHTEFDRIDDVLTELAHDHDVAVVSDAGMPGISDPGERLVQAAVEHGHDVVAVPGPVAATTALVISGLPTDRFVFEGFLARSGRARSEALEQIAVEPRTVVLYEAPHRIARTITDLASACGTDRPVAVCRELTKRYEQVIRGTLGGIDLGKPRGEYTIVLGGAPRVTKPIDDETIREALADEIEQGASRRDAVAAVVTAFAVPRNRVYALALDTT